MKPSLFLNNRGDVLMFNSREAAQRYIEPIDVENNEYVGYDSEGRLLNLSTVGQSQVSIEEAEIQAGHVEELRATLVDFLLRVGKPPEKIKAASLQELITYMVPYEIG